jgi:AraC-like DNA-binding protein
MSNPWTFIYRQIPLQVLYVNFTDAITSWHDRNLAAPFWRLYWNATPGASVLCNGEAIALDSQWIVMIPPQTRFEKRSGVPVDHFHIHFTTGMVFDSVERGIYRVRSDQFLEKQMSTAVEYIRKGEFDTVRFSLLIHSIVFQSLGRLPPTIFDTVYADPRLEKLWAFVTSRLDRKIDNKEMAAALGMGVRSLERLMQSLTGQSPQQFVAAHRIRAACNLLSYSTMSIDSIAEATGFCDRNHLTRQFCAHKGIGPAQWRKLQTWRIER